MQQLNQTILDQVAFIRTILKPSFVKESRYRISYNYMIQSGQVVKVDFRSTFILPEDKIIEILSDGRKSKEILNRLKKLPSVPIVLFSFPKSQKIINDKLIVDGEPVIRLNRFDASFYSACWLMNMYTSNFESDSTSNFSYLLEVIRAIMAYFPESNDSSLDQIRDYKYLSVKEIASWIIDRVEQSIPYEDVNLTPELINESEGKLKELISIMPIIKDEDLKKPSCNPLLAIQYFFSMSAFQNESEFNSKKSTNAIVAGAIDKYLRGSIQFLKINEKIKAEGKFSDVQPVLDNTYLLFVPLKLKLNKPYDIVFQATQYFDNPLWASKHIPIELNLDEAKSKYVRITAEEGVLSFPDQAALLDVLGKRISSKPVKEVFEVVNVETERSRLVYTTKDFISIRDSSNKIRRINRIGIPIRIEVPSTAKRIMDLILVFCSILSLIMLVFIEPTVLLAGVGIYVVLLSVALFPREHRMTLEMLKPKINILKWVAFVGFFFSGIFNFVKHFFPADRYIHPIVFIFEKLNEVISSMA